MENEQQSQEGLVFCDAKGRIGWKGVFGDKFLLLSTKTDFKEAEANLAKIGQLPILIPEVMCESRGAPGNRATNDAVHRFPTVALYICFPSIQSANVG